MICILVEDIVKHKTRDIAFYESSLYNNQVSYVFTTKTHRKSTNRFE